MPSVNTPPTIYVDFNNRDEEGLVRLDTVGTLSDLARLQLSLVNGMAVVISDGDLTAPATIRHPGEEGVWRAEVVWSEAIDRT